MVNYWYRRSSCFCLIFFIGLYNVYMTAALPALCGDVLSATLDTGVVSGANSESIHSGKLSDLPWEAWGSLQDDWLLQLVLVCVFKDSERSVC